MEAFGNIPVRDTLRLLVEKRYIWAGYADIEAWDDKWPLLSDKEKQAVEALRWVENVASAWGAHCRSYAAKRGFAWPPLVAPPAAMEVNLI